jgi:F-type H+-transporting ATPase subunit alpha
MEGVKEIEGRVQILDSLASVSVDERKKQVDCFGRSLLGDDTVGSFNRSIFAPIPKFSDIALINTPLVTGITMFDALAPIGKGQNMLLIGHDIVDMRQYVRGMLSVQVSEGTKCIYASCSSENEKVVEMLAEAGLSDKVTLVMGNKSSQQGDLPSIAAEATVTAATACAIAESLALENGVDTLVVVDTLNYHKTLWDVTTRVLVDVFGVEAVVKSDRDGGASSEMRGYFSSLIQRSARFSTTRGGGSVTLVLLCTIPKLVAANEDTIFTPNDFASSPIAVKNRIDVLIKRNVPLSIANLRKIQIPIPTDADGTRRFALQHVDDLISMSDGQIWLDEQIEAEGRRPAMDVQRSVTRIGIGADTQSRADAAAIRRVVEGLRLDLSQALDLGAADVRKTSSKTQAQTALAWLLAMHQPSTSVVRKLSESCTALLAASKGYLAPSLDAGALAGTAAGNELMAGLLEHVKANAAKAMEEVDSTKDMSKESQDAIEAAIKSYFLS